MKLELEVKDIKEVLKSVMGKSNKESEKRLKDETKEEFREAPSSSAAYFPYKERKKESSKKEK